MREYLKLKENEKQVNNLKIELLYDLGGYNYFTYESEKRGYYLYITPVNYENKNGYSTETSTAFSGIKILMKEVKRCSNKAMKETEELVKENIDKYINYVLNKHGLELQNKGE